MPETQNNSARPKLTEGSVGPTLFRLTVPMIWGLFSIVSFNLVDTYFVGQLGTVKLAAISFTFPVVMVVGSVALGLGIGVSSAISRAIGQGNHLKVQRLATDGLLLACLVVAVFAVVGLLTIGPLFRALGADPQVIPLIRRYMEIWYLGVVFVVIPMVGNNALRALGDVKIPALMMTLAAVLNIVLDRFLIFDLSGQPWLGLRGAAIATVIARFTTMIAALAVLHYRERLLLFARPKAKALLQSWKTIVHVGLPAAGTNLAVPLSLAVITFLIAYFGNEAVAGFGVATKIEAFSLLVLAAFASIMAPFVGQNSGAGRSDRVRKGLKHGFAFSLLWGALVAIVLAVFAEPLVRLFDKNTEVVSVARAYLLIVPLSYGARGIIMIACSAFNGLGKPLPSTLMNFSRVILLYLPLAYLGRWLLGYTGIFVAATVCNVSIGLIAILWSVRVWRGRSSAD